MNSLPQYDPEGRCPKCGYDTITTKYVGVNHIDRIGSTMTGGIKFLSVPEPEHLRRTCVRCGYEWKEDTVTIKEIDVRSEAT
jgi:predicted nucleic-acid-binding Zn-ribbon protein